LRISSGNTGKPNVSLLAARGKRPGRLAIEQQDRRFFLAGCHWLGLGRRTSVK
jgi:hypothetical protein